jgi:hypothetical protein
MGHNVDNMKSWGFGTAKVSHAEFKREATPLLIALQPQFFILCVMA